MLDIKLIRENPEDVIKRLAAKGKEAGEEIAKILEDDKTRRALIAETESLKAEQNRVNKLIPQFKKEGKDLKDVFAEMKELGAKIKANDEKLAAVVVPSLGRLVFLAPSLDAPNSLRFAAEPGAPIPEGEAFYNVGGDWLWPVLQSRWPSHPRADGGSHFRADRSAHRGPDHPSHGSSRRRAHAGPHPGAGGGERALSGL